MAYWTPQGLQLLAQSESSGNAAMAPYNPSNPTSSSAGLYGYLTKTWQQYAPQAGVDISQYPTANTAPADVQTRVAAITPISNWTCPDCNSTAVILANNSNYVSSTPVTDTSTGFSPSDTLTPTAPFTEDPNYQPFYIPGTSTPLTGSDGSGSAAPQAQSTLPASGSSNWFQQAFTTISDIFTRLGIGLVAIVIVGIGLYAAAKGDLGQPARRAVT